MQKIAHYIICESSLCRGYSNHNKPFVLIQNMVDETEHVQDPLHWKDIKAISSLS